MMMLGLGEGCTEAASTGLFKKETSKGIYSLVIRRGWLRGSIQLPQASAGRRHESRTTPASSGSGRRSLDMLSPPLPTMRQGVPQSRPCPGAAGYGIDVPHGNAKAL